MKKSILLSIISLFSLSLVSCSSNQTQILPDLQDNTEISSKQKDISLKIKLDNPAFLSQQANEMSGVALNDDGRIYKYQTLKNGASFTATTFLYQNKWSLLESHPTTALEAQTILRLASQGGFAKEYKTLKDRYEQIGLVDSKK